jgi:AcrR family transcriptional regulator
MSVLETRLETRFERRKNRTRTQIRQAVVDLVEEVGYHRLTVQKITERADIGHGTFYLHYRDIDDALWDVVLATMTAEQQVTIVKVLQVPEALREYYGWLWFFQVVGDQRERFLSLFGSQGSAELRRRYQQYLTETYARGMREGIYHARIDLPLDFVTQFMAGATIQLLLWWLETPNDYTPDDMARMLYRMIYRAEVPTTQIQAAQVQD